MTTWRFQTLWPRRVTMLWQSTSGYIRYSERRCTSAAPASHYGWCRYVKVWAIAMFLSSRIIWWWSDETYWDWWEACSRTNCKTRCCHCTTNIKTWLLPCLCPLQTIIMYQYDAWSWIRVWVNTVLKLSISEYDKVLYSPSLDNGEFNLLRSLVVTKAICAEENEGRVGLAGQRNTLVQCTSSIIMIHRLFVLQGISGEWKYNITL